MKTSSTINKYILGLSFTLGVLLSVPASAATFSSCTSAIAPAYDISTKVTGAVDCTISDDFDQDFLNTNPITVNTPTGFFDITNWIFGGKIGVNAGYVGTGIDGQSGTYNISAVSDVANWLDIMLVFKSGNDNSGVFLVGYLLGEGVLSGNWLTPFLDPPFDLPGGSTKKDVSHISVYYTQCPPGASCVPPSEVPLPAAFPLLLAGLGGLTWLSRSRKRKLAV